MSGNTHMTSAITPCGIWASFFLGMALVSAPTPLPAQISLATVVDLAQRNSSTVRLAGAEVEKAQAALSETRDVFVPDLIFGSGLPAIPSVGFSGNPPSVIEASMQSIVFSPSQGQYIRAARTRLEVAALNLKNAREEVVLEASAAYIELDTVNQELTATRQQVYFADRLVTIEKQRTEAGVDPISELKQAQLTVAELELKSVHLEARAGELVQQLAMIAGIAEASFALDHESIPDIPAVSAEESGCRPAAIESAQMLARAKQQMEQGDRLYALLPRISFFAGYNRNTTLLNHADYYYAHPLKADNFSSGFSIQVPLFGLAQRARTRGSAAESLRATVEAKQAEKQNDLNIAQLNHKLRELTAQAKIASIKQEIADAQLRTVLIELESGNGTERTPSPQPQLTPKAEQLVRIEEHQKFLDLLEIGLELKKARLALLRALGHMEDWLHELRVK